MGTYGAAWQSGGYCGSGNVEPLIGSLCGRTAVVVGSAFTVFEELRYVLTRYVEPIVFAVNDIGMFLPKVDHWVSLHADNLGVWKAVRWLQARNMEACKYHTPDPRPVTDYCWERLTPMFCLSGYFAMQIAYIMGAQLVILVGCPGEPVRRFFEAGARTDFGYGGSQFNGDQGVRAQLEHEMHRLPDFKNKVRSTSGWTKTYFGAA